MWIKFGNTLVNLDLIKEIHPVEKLILGLWHDDHTKMSRCYSRNRTKEEQEEQIRNAIQRKVDNDRFGGFGWSFDIEYLNGERKNILGKCEKEIHDARDEFYLLVSDNQSDLPHIEVEEQTDRHGHYERVQWDGEIGDW